MNSVNYTIASFDIECDSSHGDFPIAEKGYNKLCIELYDSLTNSATMIQLFKVLVNVYSSRL